MMLLVSVAIGGAVGAVLRHAIYIVVGRAGGFPYGTLIVNVLGCFGIGFLLYLIDHRQSLDTQWRPLLVTGLLGSFTTFSTFGYETIALWSAGERVSALTVVLANVVLGCGAVVLGWRLGSNLS
jgi:CrcB protein